MRNFQNRFGISVWKFMRDKHKPTFLNRRFGIGKL